MERNEKQKSEQRTSLRETGTLAATPSTTQVQDVQDHVLAGNLTKMITRRWKAGDVYAPHDLSPVEFEKWRKRNRPSYDAFDVLDMNPLDHYRVCFYLPQTLCRWIQSRKLDERLTSE
jgi:small subunit ribosomal protein S18